MSSLVPAALGRTAERRIGSGDPTMLGSILKKPLRSKILVGVAATVVAMQFVRPEKNAGPAEPGPHSLEVWQQAPPEVRRILAVACNDCHSEHTRYPWYAEIQPAGWFLGKHVHDGLGAMNLSRFGKLSAKAQGKRLQYMIEAMTDREMPLKSYLLIHHDAQLTDAEIKTFTTWAESVQAKLGP
jgi:hypothetical protein